MNVTTSLTKKRNTGNPGDITETVFVELSNCKYRIERYDSHTIRIFNLETQEYEVTKPLLRKINSEMNLAIDLKLTTGRDKTTRNLGRQVIRELMVQSKNLKENETNL